MYLDKWREIIVGKGVDGVSFFMFRMWKFSTRTRIYEGVLRDRQGPGLEDELADDGGDEAIQVL